MTQVVNRRVPLKKAKHQTKQKMKNQMKQKRYENEIKYHRLVVQSVRERSYSNVNIVR